MASSAWSANSTVYSGNALQEPVNQTSHGFSVQQVVYRTGGLWALATASSAAAAEAIGIISAVVDANNFVITLAGKISGLSGLTGDIAYYLDSATPGALNTSPPSIVGYVDKPILIASSSSTGYVVMYRGMVLTSSQVPLSEVRAYLVSVTGSLSSGWNKVALDAEDWDSKSEFASSKFTATRAGKYHITASIAIINATGGASDMNCYIAIRTNGVATQQLNETWERSVNNNESAILTGATDILLAAGDYIEIWEYCSVSHKINGGSTATFATIREMPPNFTPYGYQSTVQQWMGF